MTTPPGDPYDTPPRMAPESGQPGPMPPPPPGYGPPADYGQPPGYAPPGYGGYGYRQPSNGMGITALVLGIIGAILSIFIIGGILTVLAIIFGVIGRGKAKRGEATNGGMALAGLILGIVGTVIAAVLLIFALANRDKIERYNDCVTEARGDRAAIEVCADRFGQELRGD